MGDYPRYDETSNGDRKESEQKQTDDFGGAPTNLPDAPFTAFVEGDDSH